MASRFNGFAPEAMRFLSSLKKNNRREWFQPRKEQYEALVKGPMLELIEAINADLAKHAPDFVTDPKKAIFRVYRDTRFSADKRPYKTNVAATFHRRGVDGCGMYFSISPEEVWVGGGIYHPSREVLLAVRQHIAEDHAKLRRMLASPKVKKIGAKLGGGELSRAPKGFDPAHPAIDLIKKTDWILGVELESKIATTPDLYKELATKLRAVAPFVTFFNEPLAATSRKAASAQDHW